MRNYVIILATTVLFLMRYFKKIFLLLFVMFVFLNILESFSDNGNNN